MNVRGGAGQRPQNRRDLILNAAQELFARDGYGSTGIRAIAAEVGISEATIYHYFRSKDEILDAIISRTAEGQLQAYRFPDDMSMEEVLHSVGKTFLTAMETRRNRDLIHLLLTEAGHDQRRAEQYLAEIWDKGQLALEDALIHRLPDNSRVRAATISKIILSALTCFVIHNETLAAVAGRQLECEVDPERMNFLDEVVEVIMRGA